MPQHPDILMKTLRELQMKIASQEQRLVGQWRSDERDMTKRDVAILRSELAAFLGDSNSYRDAA